MDIGRHYARAAFQNKLDPFGALPNLSDPSVCFYLGRADHFAALITFQPK